MNLFRVSWWMHSLYFQFGLLVLLSIGLFVIRLSLFHSCMCCFFHGTFFYLNSFMQINSNLRRRGRWREGHRAPRVYETHRCVCEAGQSIIRVFSTICMSDNIRLTGDPEPGWCLNVCVY